jgi:cytosine/uracil/thiamine/allantoin permease
VSALHIALDADVSIEIEHSTLYNKDLAPVPASRRTWRVASFAAL